MKRHTRKHISQLLQSFVTIYFVPSTQILHGLMQRLLLRYMCNGHGKSEFNHYFQQEIELNNYRIDWLSPGIYIDKIARKYRSQFKAHSNFVCLKYDFHWWWLQYVYATLPNQGKGLVFRASVWYSNCLTMGQDLRLDKDIL